MWTAVEYYQAENERLRGEVNGLCSRFEEGTASGSATRKGLQDVKKRLRLLHQHIVLDIQKIHAYYRGEMGDAAGDAHPLLSAFFGPATAGRARAEHKRAISREKSETIRPFNEVKLAIKDSIQWIDDCFEWVSRGEQG